MTRHANQHSFAGTVLALALCMPVAPLAVQAITVVSWGGSYAWASQEAFHKPFTAETGIEVRLEGYNGDELNERFIV